MDSVMVTGPSSSLFAFIILLGALATAAVTQDVAKEEAVFSCSGRTAGYYADVQSGCQKYHMCDAGGRLYSYTCPNRTLFQQRVMICDHWFMVDCSLSENYFSSNLHIGVKGKPFLEGNEQAYHVTRETTSFNRLKTTPYQRSAAVTTPYRRGFESSSTSPYRQYLANSKNTRRYEASSTSTPTRRYEASTTPYPWQQTSPKTVSQVPAFNNTKAQFSNEKPASQSLPKYRDDGKYQHFSNESPKNTDDGKYRHFADKKESPAVKAVEDGASLPKAFIQSVSTSTTPVAPLLITGKGQPHLLTSPNVFDKYQPALKNTPSTTTTTTTTTTSRTTTTTAASPLTNQSGVSTLHNALHNNQSIRPTGAPLNSGHKVVTTQGPLRNTQVSTESPLTTRGPLRNTHLSTESPVATQKPLFIAQHQADLTSANIDHDLEEDLLSNTVQVRIPDTRHMFYIADNPLRAAEMLTVNNETVLTISLPASSTKHHGAMRFKGLRSAKGRRVDCPQCHPAFLLPGKCQPCVLIR